MYSRRRRRRRKTWGCKSRTVGACAGRARRDWERERGSVCIDRAGPRGWGGSTHAAHRSSTVYASRFHQVVGNSMIGFSVEDGDQKEGGPLDYKPRVLLPPIS